MLGPRLEKIMAGHETKADFAKVDIDQLSDLAFKYNVSKPLSSGSVILALVHFYGLLCQGQLRAHRDGLQEWKASRPVRRTAR